MDCGWYVRKFLGILDFGKLKFKTFFFDLYFSYITFDKSMLNKLLSSDSFEDGKLWIVLSLTFQEVSCEARVAYEPSCVNCNFSEFIERR